MDLNSATPLACPDARRDLIFRRLFEAGITGIFCADTGGLIRRANDAFLGLLGYERGDLPLRSDELTPPEWASVDEAKRRELVTTGIALPWEKEYWHRDGHRVPVLLGVALLEGSRTETVGFVFDRTWQVRHERRAKNLAASIDAAEEQARRRIGKGIHDEIGQNLAIAKLKLRDLERLPLPAAAGDSLAEIRRLLDRSVHACRGLAFELASPVLYELGLDAALQDLGHRVEKRHGIRCEIRTDLGAAVLDRELSGALFRIARELIHNVVKHAQARTLWVHLNASDQEVRIFIADDGVGFDAGTGSSALGGFGLVSARERMSRLGGRLWIDSCPGGGTRVQIVAPSRNGSQSLGSPGRKSSR